MEFIEKSPNKWVALFHGTAAAQSCIHPGTLDIRKKSSTVRVVRSSDGCPVPDNFQGKAGSSPGQPDLDVDVPFQFRRVGLVDL